MDCAADLPRMLLYLAVALLIELPTAAASHAPARISARLPPRRWRRCRPYFTSDNGNIIYSDPVRSQCGPDDAYTHETDLAGPDSPCDAPGAYPIFWNVGGCSIYDPGTKCNASTRDKIPVDPTTFGIMGANWTQTNICTLNNCQPWQPSFRSLMPVVSLNGSGALLNGGVPQNGNLSAFVYQLRAQVPLWIPQEQWSGNAVLDFEAWSTVWELNVEDGIGFHSKVYQNISRKLVRAKHPNFSAAQVEALAKQEFEAAATLWLVTALETCKQIRPHAFWGLYGLPQGSAPQAYAEHQMPIYLASSALFPSIYDYSSCSNTTADHKSQVAYTRSLVTQTVSLAKAVFAARPGLSRPPPVYPFMSEVCRAAGPPILDDDDMRAGLVAPYDAGASGVVVWGMPMGDMAASHVNASEYWAHFSTKTGPIAQAASTAAELCAVRRCSGNGRCVGLFNESHDGYVPAQLQCECEVPWGGVSCDLNLCVSPEGVAIASCYGWDAFDTTGTLQLALSDESISKLIIDLPPDPAVGWITRSLFITRDDLTVIFQDGVLLQARQGFFQTVEGDQASLLTLYKAKNVTLQGEGNATLRMRRTDYTNGSMGYTAHSEWRHGINLLHVDSVRIHGLRVEQTGGDGIYILGESDIHISDCVLDSNFRQGMSVINVSNLLVERTIFSNTDGTPPMAGVDLEPDSHCMMLNNVTFRDCASTGNSGFGWILSPHMLNASSCPLSILVDNLTVSGTATPPPKDVAHPSWRPGMGIGITGVNEAGAMLEDWGTGALRGSIVISNSTVHDTWGSGLFVTSKGSNAAGLLISEVRFENVQRQPVGANCPAPVSKSCPPPPGSYAVPIEIGGNSHSCFETGGIRFVSCSVVDSYDRPFITMDNDAGQCAKTKSGEWGLVNISGEFKITNEFGCRYSKSANESGIALTVDCVEDSGFPGLKSDDYNRKKPLLPRGREIRVNNLTDIWGRNWTELCGLKAGKLIAGVRGPELVQTPNKLLLFGQCRRADQQPPPFSAGSSDSGDLGNGLGDNMLHDRIVLTTSTDAGRSWSNATFISTKSRGMGVGIYDHVAKMVIFQYHSFTQMTTYTGNRLLQRRSTDEGASWSAERDITHFVAPVCNSGSGGQVVGGAGSKLQTSTGRLIFSGHNNGHSSPPGGICVWYSDDGGLTYNVSESGVFLGNENSIADFGNGTLYMNGRGYVFPWKGYRTSYWSHNDGLTWSSGEKLTDVQEPTSAGCEGALLAIPNKIKNANASAAAATATPPRLFFAEPSGRRRDGVRTGTERISLRLWCSLDGGRTWPNYIAINTGDGAGYSALEYTLQANGEPMLVVVWEGSQGPQGTSLPPYGNASVGTMFSWTTTVDDWCPSPRLAGTDLRNM